MAKGSPAVAMVGIISLAPVLGNILTPIVGPIYSALEQIQLCLQQHFLQMIWGAPFALGMAKNPEAGRLEVSIILGSMMGPTIVFTIPVALGITLEKDDKPFLAKGILAFGINITSLESTCRWISGLDSQ